MKQLLVFALLMLTTQKPIPTYVWQGDNPAKKMMRSMHTVASKDLVDRIWRTKQATLAEVQALFLQSKSEEYLDAFMRSEEVTVIVVAVPNTPGFGQLLVSKKDGVTNYWFLQERNGRDGCMEVYNHFSDGPSSDADLKRADAAAGPMQTGGLISFAVARLCR